MPITLLLADDSVVIQKLVGLSFANEDIEIVTVDNGDDAVTQAVACKPDIVLADVVMPGKSGYDVCASIRNNPEMSNTPVLLLTGTFEAFDEGRANAVGATGHITKPFEAQALADRVTQILAEQSSAASAAPAADANDFFDDNANYLAAEPSDLLDGAGGDRTVAIMPEPLAAISRDDDFAAPATFADAAPVAADATPNPDQTLLVDDFLASPDMASGAAPGETSPANPIGALNLQTIAAPAPMDFSDSPSQRQLQHDDLDTPLASPLDDDFMDLDALGFEAVSAPIPTADFATPSGDATMLADDWFSAGPDIDDGFGESINTPMAPPIAPPTPTSPSASQGLDIDFGVTPMAESIVPDNAENYDVSSSDLGAPHDLGTPHDLGAPINDTPSWSEGVPAGVVTGPAPVEVPRETAAPPLEVAGDPASMLDDLATPGLDTSWNTPDTASIEPELLPGDTSEFASALDLAGGMPGLEVDVNESTASASGSGARPDLTPNLTPMMRDRIHDTLEKVAWEAFSDISDELVTKLMQRVEQIAWEVIPQMAETLIQEEIRRMKGEEGEE